MKAGRLIAFTGGIRSGKSRLAEERFKAWLRAHPRVKAAYLSTADSRRADPELRERILAHRLRRPAAWATIDACRGLEKALDQAQAKGCRALLLDGLGMWAALQLKRGPEEAASEVGRFCAQARRRFSLLVLVLDEAGLGGISMNKAARRFADLNGLANQAACAEVDEAYFVAAGKAFKASKA